MSYRYQSMHGSELAEYATFIAVARKKSFRKAAVERGVAASAVSHTVRSLEERVGVRLFHRTTRSVSLTDAGERFLAELEPAFMQIERALDTLNGFRETPFGTVKLNVPTSIAPFLLNGIMGPLLQKNPGLRLDIVATDKLVDIVEDGYDAGFRFSERLSQDVVAVRTKLRLRFAVVASPAYLEGRTLPKTPDDLRAHDCIRYRFPSGALFNWQFERAGKEVEVEVNGPITLDDQGLMVHAALQGCGLAYVWDDHVHEQLARGSLVRCLEDWCPVDDGLYLYYPSRRHVSLGLRALIDLLKAPG